MKGLGTMDLFCLRDLCTAKVHPQDLFVRAPEIFKMRTSSLNVTLFDENYHKFTSNEIRKKHFPWKVSGSDRCGSVGEISVEKHMETEMQEMVLYPLPETNRELAPAKFMVGVNDIFPFGAILAYLLGLLHCSNFPKSTTDFGTGVLTDLKRSSEKQHCFFNSAIFWKLYRVQTCKQKSTSFLSWKISASYQSGTHHSPIESFRISGQHYRPVIWWDNTEPS